MSCLIRCFLLIFAFSCGTLNLRSGESRSHLEIGVQATQCLVKLYAIRSLGIKSEPILLLVGEGGF